MGMARNVEVWIFGGFGALVLAACLSTPAERTAAPGATPTAPAGAVAKTTMEPPQAAVQPTYVVYVTGKRPSAAEKRARDRAG